ISLRSLLGRLLEKLGSGQRHTIVTARHGELTARRWSPDEQMLWEGAIEPPGRTAPLKIALWGGRAGPAEEEIAFLDRLLNDLGRLEELGRKALDESPDREKWPQSAQGATFTLSSLQADEEEDGVFVLTFTSPQDPESEYFVDFSDGTVEGVSR